MHSWRGRPWLQEIVPLLGAAFTPPGAQLSQGTETQPPLCAVLSSAADIDAAPFSSCRVSVLRAPAPNICTMYQAFREEGNARAALEPGCCRWQQNVLPRAQRCSLSPVWWILPSPLAVEEAAVAKALGSFKNRRYLVINEVLKMRYKRLNVLSHLLGPYVLGKHLSVL